MSCTIYRTEIRYNIEGIRFRMKHNLKKKKYKLKDMIYKAQSAAQCSIEGEVGVSQGRISMRAVAATLLQPVSNYFLNNSQLFPRLFQNDFFEN